ncbi:MAG: hypothetical protein KIS81_12300 [Maricaulaceae bacterium]|nr:hypothetical protein [Maricaulaceae bacterium]
MMFLLRSIFWLAVVGAFVPRDFAGVTEHVPLPDFAAAPPSFSSVDDFCGQWPLVCLAGAEAGRLSMAAAETAAAQIETWLDERPARESAAASNSPAS